MNTERRYLLAVALSFLVLVVFYGPIFNSGRPRRAATTSAVKDDFVEQTKQDEKSTGSYLTKPTDQVSEAMEGETYELQNDIYTARFTSVGAAIFELRLKKWAKKKMGDINLIEPTPGLPPAFVVSVASQPLLLGATNFKLEQLDPKSKSIGFVAESNGLRVRKQFRLFPEKPALQLSVEIENASDQTKQVPLEISSQLHFGKTTDQYEHDQLESFVAIKNGKVQVTKEKKIRKQPVLVNDAIEWQALTRKYLSVIVKPEKPAIFSETKLSSNHEAFETTLRFSPETIEPNAKVVANFLIYAGPEYYEDLKLFGFEETLTQGTWGAFRHWLFLALRLCRNISGNYGFAILLMTFFLKVLFSPFTHMSFESMRKMQLIQPKLKAIQAQFKNDPTKLNKETMDLYRRHKVNPMGGCLPMLIQIPIFIGFYQVLAQFVELKGESFWWIKDLTQPDRIAKLPFLSLDLNLLPLLMIGTMIWQQKVTPQQSMGSPEQTKMMQFMPIMFGFLFYKLPAGLVLYWTLNNLLTVTHQLFFHRRSKSIVAAE